ncbi:MAG: tRNA lysidine(34) synthetase TilS [bacterium]
MTDPLGALRAAQTSGLMPPGRLLIACSGGADSLALLHAAAAVGGWDLGAAVVDHGLLPHGGPACRAVEAAAGQLALPVFVLPVVLGDGRGPEDRARRARLAALEACARQEGFPLIALAHTREDQLETVLMRLAEGAGVRGLGGMAAARGCLRRPWLGVSRADVRDWGAARGLLPVVDESNDDPRFLRNRIRHELLPAFDRVFGPGWRGAAAASAEHARQADALLDDLAARVEATAVRQVGAELAVRGLSSAPPVVGRRVLVRVLRRLGTAPRRDRTTLAALEAVGPGSVDLPGGLRARRAGDTLWLGPRPRPRSPAPEAVLVPGPGSYRWGEVLVRVAPDDGTGDQRVDAAAAPFPWTLRAVAVGERVHLLGAPGRKRVARLFSDAGVPASARGGPVLADAQGIVWIHGLRAVERVRHRSGPAWRIEVHPVGESSGALLASDA